MHTVTWWLFIPPPPPPELGINSQYSFDATGRATFTRTVIVMFPDDDILNEIAENRVIMILQADIQSAVIVDGYDSAVVIVIDDDSKSSEY